MSLLDLFKKIFSGSKSRGSKEIINYYIRDNKCGEKIKLVFRKGYDIVQEYDSDSEEDYSIRKTAICDNCYNQIEIKLKFDMNYNIIEEQLDGGESISEEEFHEQNDA